MSDPVVVEILPPVPYEIPFTEDWESGLFTTNQWMTSSSNWMMTVAGNPGYAAQFSWSPQVTDYESYLTSFSFNGVGHTSLWLSFDLLLNNYSTAAENFMSVDVYNENTRSWNTVHTFSSYENDGLGWDYTTFSFDITPYAAGEVFKVRFRAHGEDSYEINFWNIYNIIIDPMPVVMAPVEDLTLVKTDTHMQLSWDPVPGAQWYAIYVSYLPEGPYLYVTTVPNTALELPIASLPEDTAFLHITAGVGPTP